MADVEPAGSNGESQKGHDALASEEMIRIPVIKLDGRYLIYYQFTEIAAL